MTPDQDPFALLGAKPVKTPPPSTDPYQQLGSKSVGGQTTQTPEAPSDEPPFWQAIRAGLRTIQTATTGQDNPFAADMLTGAAKGAARTVTGLGELASKEPGIAQVNAFLDAKAGMPGASQRSFGVAREQLKPRTQGESVGGTTEQAAEFMIPGGASEIQAATKAGKGLLGAILRESALAGAVGSAQEGKVSATPFIAGGVSAAASPIIGKGLQWAGERIEKSLMKATARDVANGFKISNVFKNDLGGTLSESFDKSTTKLSDLSGQLKAELGKTGPGGVLPEVDVADALAATEKALQANAGRTFGRNVNIQKAIDNFRNDPAFMSLTNQGKADLLAANEIKRGVGDLGAWVAGTRDIDSSAMEIVANEFYTQLKTRIEQAAVNGPARIQELNKQMAEIIPIRQAIIRRIPVDQRSNVINLGDMIGLASGDIGIALANRALRSGRVANLAVQSGNLLQQSPTGARVMAGLASQVKR